MAYATTILSPTTASESSTEFSAILNNMTLVSVVGLQGAETATLQFKDPISGTFVDCPEYVIRATTNPFLVTPVGDPGVYRISKSATISPVGVSLQQNTNTQVIKLGGN